MKKTQEKIIMQYAKINKIYTITQVTAFTLLPLLLISNLVIHENSYLKPIILYVIFAYCGVALFVLFILRRCPNCYSWLPQYFFDPKSCPYCNMRLK